MTLNDRIIAFSELGNFLSQFNEDSTSQKTDVLHNEQFFDTFLSLCERAQHKNGWFLPEQVYFATTQWAKALTKSNLTNWTDSYNFSNNNEPKTVGIIMAGNIPLVGFHDLLCILISGHKVLIKPSSNDTKLITTICDYLIRVLPEFKNFIQFTEGKLENHDAIIATGSNNTARYFEYYFKNKPHIIRKNRNSVAVLTGNETKNELIALGEDIFRYYGLGCRSVSKLFVPKNYDFDLFFNAMFTYQDLIKQEKYTNNYDYNKAVYLMSQFNLLDNGFLILKEDQSYSSPISSLFYEFYEHYDALNSKFNSDEEHLQCIVNYPESTKNVDFGATQTPQLSDYADGIDTIDFLLKI
ncbi:acyl-CoA reductase [Aquimarina agarilytica]|uniref:acyl-CoA reductase n=1 Tax=Aquimarina agarilytica TaxID=1087449 RepID=UPI00028A25DE|nr:acyl-CoA reductase [Aquimarina agarilytica]